MLKINFKLALRNIFRNKLYTAINIIGLGVASAFCILVYMYVKNEQSFDNFHNDSADLFRVEESRIFGRNKDQQKKGFFSFLTTNADQKNMIQTPLPFGPDLKKNFPEVEAAVRLKTGYDIMVRIGDQSFKEKDNAVAYVDPNFFQVLNYPLLEGNKASVLSSINQVVISQRMARKYFGNADPLGKTINITSDKLLLTVSGVAKDFPQNSSFQYDILIPAQADGYYKRGMAQGVNSFSHLLVIKLVPGTNVANFQRKLDAFSKTYFQPLTESMARYDPQNKPKPIQVYLRPFALAHYNQSDGWDHYTDLKNIYQLICLTIVILLIACLNYVLLTLTSAISRSQSVGVRKTIGAGRKQIIFQFYVETQLLAFIAVITGFFTAMICLPFFNSLINSNFNISDFSFVDVSLMLFALAIVLGLLAGIYPALAMSGLKPLNIMRNFSAYRIRPGLSKGLVVLQYTICIILVISALVINKQMHFLNNANMGFDKSQVVVLQNPYGWDDKTNRNSLKARLTQFVNSQPYLQGITSTYFNFGGYNTNGFILNGEQIAVHEMNVDFNYFTFNKIPIIKGRNFSTAFHGDSAAIKLDSTQMIAHSSAAEHNVVVNETLYNLLGKPKLDIVNRTLGGVIVGVCKDYNVDDLTKKIEPAYHQIQGNPSGYFWIKIGPGQNIPQAMDKLQAGWNRITGNLPFSYSFMDQDVAKNYEAYRRWMGTITTSCILAILIACLGLFGLSGLTTLNRTKEIGIRKVLGASVSNLFVLLNRGTLYLAAGSFVIAAPIAFYFVSQWLDNFAYRIKPDWLLFTSAGAIAMLTAIIAVSYHTVKAAVANPVSSLRNE